MLESRPSTTDPVKSSTPVKKYCVVCKNVCKSKIKRCRKCKSGCYCSRSCRNSHSAEHATLCQAIQDLEVLEQSKRVFSVRESSQVNMKVNMRNRLVRLIGEKPMVNCTLNGEECCGLWDTGSMVSLLNKDWFKEKFPEENVLSVSEFLEGDNLNLCAANNTKVEVEGVAVVAFGFGENFKVNVPFLITKDQLNQPIIGFNVIEHIVLSGNESVPTVLKNLLMVSKNSATSIASIIRENSELNASGEAKTIDKTLLPPNSRCRVKCKTGLKTSEKEQAVLFTPELLDSELECEESISKLKIGRTSFITVMVSNPTNSEKWIEKNVVLGSVENISAVIPIFPKAESKKKKRPEGKGSSSVLTSEGKWLPECDLSHLSKKKKSIVEEALIEVCDVFQKSEDDHGDLPDFQMEISLCDSVPVCVPHRNIPRQLYDEVKNYINDLIANKWVRESKSPYSSPIVCVRKKDQSLRLCIDYRNLNKKIVPDKQPIPRIQEIMDSLGGQKWFSTLDMAKAYHQGYVKEEFRKFTAFSTPWGLYEWIRIPMGISNAPPAFQRYVNQVLMGLRDRICIAYLDDILVYGKTFKQSVQNLKTVLHRLKARGVKLRADKCKFLMQEVRYLGRLISKEGYRPDPEDAEALDKFRIPPKTVGELRTLLGFFSYYRSYVKDFAKKFKPLYDLLKSKGKGSVNPELKPKKMKQTQIPSKTKISWNAGLQKIVDANIEYLKSPEFLAFPDFDVPFVVHCDASEQGLGAVLYQKQEGVNRVISFASRSLTEPEKNYHLHSGKLEFLALKWALTERFADYLSYGPPFTVFTDNNPLTYVMSSAKLNATGLRWVAELSNLQFNIKYKPGKKHGDADGLSRQQENDLDALETACTEEINLENLSTVMSVCQNSIAPKCGSHVNVNVLELKKPSSTIHPINSDQLKQSQIADPVIGPVYAAVNDGHKPTNDERSKLSQSSKVLLKQLPKLKLENGLLIRELRNRKQLVLPSCYLELVFVELHQKMGHLGSDRVEELCRQRFYWPYMRKDIQNYIRRKCSCVASKKPNIQERAPLFPIQASYPFEMVSVDFLHLDRCKGNFNYVLVVTDHFTRFSQAYATKTKSSKAAARKLFNEFIPQFGFPKRIHHDRGGEFNSGLFLELHRLAGIKVSNTTPYHPMGDGQVERLNRTLINMLKTIPESEKQNWREHLPKLLFAYNSTVNKTTGFSPFYLMFGRESRLPIDCMLPIDISTAANNKSHDKFVEEWRTSMKEAFQVANKEIKKSGEYNKRHYDKKIKDVEIKKGDRVLIRNVDKGGTGKLKTFWEQRIYEVIGKHELVPVYTIRPLNGKKTKIVHRNMLMKVNDLPVDTFGQKPDIQSNRKEREQKQKSWIEKKRSGKKAAIMKEKKFIENTIDSESESESDIILVKYGGNSHKGPSVPEEALPEITPEEEDYTLMTDNDDDETIVVNEEMINEEEEDKMVNDKEEEDEMMNDEEEEEEMMNDEEEEEEMMNDEEEKEEMVNEKDDEIVNDEENEASGGQSSDDETFHGFETEDEADDTTETEEDNDEKPVRRSSRPKRRKEIYTYDELGEPRISRYNAFF